jgi:hypothetical protein
MVGSAFIGQVKERTEFNVMKINEQEVKLLSDFSNVVTLTILQARKILPYGYIWLTNYILPKYA